MKAKYIERLEKLYTELNYKGWDGYGADPITKESYENTKQIIKEVPEDILQHFHLFPGVWGGLLLELKGELIGGMLVFEDSFTYVAGLEKGEEMVGEGNKKFNIEDAISALKEIVNFHKL